MTLARSLKICFRSSDLPHTDHMEVPQTQEKISQPKCWTRWIRENKTELKVLSTWPHQHLKMRDGRFRYTIVHALMAGDIEEEVVRQCFSVLRKNSLISLITAKDKEGDTPLHSAIRSGAKPELITLLMNTISKPSTKRRLLLELNKKGELPIINAFNLQKWPIVEVLLEECIKCKLLPELTGMDPNISESKTLLFKAMKRGYICYLEIFFRVCKKCTNSVPIRAILVPNRRGGYTPWYHFLSLDAEQIRLGLEHLEEYGIDINKLLCDPAGRTSLLHEAYRRNNSIVCKLLIDHGARMNQLDANKLSPQQRRRTLSLSSRPSTPIHEPPFQLSVMERTLEDVSEGPVSVQQRTLEPEQPVPEKDNDRNGAIEEERAEPKTDCLSEHSECEQQREAEDSGHRLTVADIRRLEALNLALPRQRKEPFICLSPRQEESPDRRYSPVCIVPPQWKFKLHLKCCQQQFIVDSNLPILLRLCRPTRASHYYAEVKSRPCVDELCPIMSHDQCVGSFNTMTYPASIS